MDHTNAPPERRGAFIAASKRRMIHALAEGPEAEGFVAVCTLLTALFHHTMLDELERLREGYEPIDPHGPTSAVAQDAAAHAATFLAELEGVLATANFAERSFSGLVGKASAETLQDIRIKTNEAGVRRVRFFVRGLKRDTVRVPKWFGLSSREIETELFEDVVICVELKTEAELTRREAKAVKRVRRGARAGTVLLKHFAAVPVADLIGLHPNAMPAMKRRDQVILGAPAVVGGLPLLAQAGPAAAVIFAVAAAYFGYQGAVAESDWKRAVAALSGFVALGAFMMRQRLKFEAQRLKYHKRLSDTVYFHTLANNQGVIDGLVGEAEAQEVKEAILAYWALRTHGPMTRTALDAACEAALRTRLNLEVDFEIGDALAKLEGLGLLERAGGDDALAAVAPEQALERLDAAWDAIFKWSGRSRRDALGA